MTDIDLTSAPSLSDIHAELTAPGAFFEMASHEIRGVPTRTWKKAYPHLRAILERSRRYGELSFLVYEDERLTFEETYQRVVALARRMATDFDVRKGDRVTIAMRNYPEWPIAFFATAAIGAVVVPLNAWWTGPELEFGIRDSGSKLAFLDDERLERLAPHLPGLGIQVIAVRMPNAATLGHSSFAALVTDASAEGELPDVAIDPDDDVTIFYTSGTTGRPKGALGTHRNICTSLFNLVYAAARAGRRRGRSPESLIPRTQSASLISVPFFHVTGCHAILVAATAYGSKLVMMHKWNPERALELIERERLTYFGGVPAMVWQVIESPDFAKRDTSSIKNVGYGGAPAAPELVKRVRELFPEASASNGYGLTETSSVTSSNAGLDYLRKPESVGLPAPVCDVKIVDADGNAREAGEVGELWIRGPNVVKGYWNNPEETRATFTDGWLHTGDLARIDDEGFIYIVDRAKDIIIRGGENVYCVEVEDALYSHPAVMDAGVIGMPHRVLGEEVGAVVQVKPGVEVTEGALQAHVRARLASFKVPVRIELRQEPLPRNANGKILKRQLKDDWGL